MIEAFLSVALEYFESGSAHRRRLLGTLPLLVAALLVGLVLLEGYFLIGWLVLMCVIWIFVIYGPEIRGLIDDVFDSR